VSYKACPYLGGRPTPVKNAYNITTPLASVNFAAFAFETLDKLGQEGYKSRPTMSLTYPLRGVEVMMSRRSLDPEGGDHDP
jgi:hypothetical protein